MKRRVRWFREAIEDLTSHVTYVAVDSPASARMIVTRLRQAGDDLALFATGRPGRMASTFERVLADIPYTIVYSEDVIAGEEVISILRVVHHAQRWPPDEN